MFQHAHPTWRGTLSSEDLPIEKLRSAGAPGARVPISARYGVSAMEVQLCPDLQAKLVRLAAESGRDTQALVREAVERFVDYDEWFLRKVDEA